MKRALISVSNKAGLVDFAKGLEEMGWELISTGGTYSALKENGLKAIPVDEITGFPECLDGRVKTLHPKIHGGILALRNKPEHMTTLDKLGIDTIDMVVVNLYPFKETILKPSVTLEEAIENIDIGGPSMVRAAAKNHPFVTVVVHPEDYPVILSELRDSGTVSDELRFKLAAKAFMHTAHYDAMISAYLKEKAGVEAYPDTLTLTYEKVQDLRYGENPHQEAAFYKEPGALGGRLTDAAQLHGKELSFNNIHDTQGALALLKEFDEPAIVACKHANPCGVGTGSSISEAYKNAYEADTVSIYGGIIVANREIDPDTAREINKIFVEILLAPSFHPEALEILKKKKNIRLLALPGLDKHRQDTDIKRVSGGILIQQADNELLQPDSLRVVTKRQPTEKEMSDMLFTWKIVKHVKSNGIAIGRNNQSVGIGPGQVNRIWACRQAIEHGVEFLGADALKGAALASDAYFPFPDCVEEAAKAGITSIIQPGGSIRDQESIDACNKYGIAMVFTDMRHFKH